MKKLLGAGLILWVASVSFAPSSGSADAGNTLLQQHNVKPTPKWRRWHSNRGEEVQSVPELDPKTSAQALTLLLGGLILSRQKRRSVA